MPHIICINRRLWHGKSLGQNVCLLAGFYDVVRSLDGLIEMPIGVLDQFSSELCSPLQEAGYVAYASVTGTRVPQQEYERRRARLASRLAVWITSIAHRMPVRSVLVF